MTLSMKSCGWWGCLFYAATAPFSAMGQSLAHDPRLPVLIADAGRPTGLDISNRPASVARFPFASSITGSDRFDLARMRSRTATTEIGPVQLSLSADRATSAPRREDMPFALDRWSLKGVGAMAELSLGTELALAFSGEYARMTRRLQVIDVNPRRLVTVMARVGAALDFSGESRLSLDYLSIARSSGHDDLTRLAETLGGAPLTGNGPELSYTIGSSTARGATSWRLSLGSMQRPTRDLGMIGAPASVLDTRAMASFSVPL